MTGDWISTKDRLPDEYEYFTALVYLEAGVYDVAVYDTEHGFRPWYSAFFEDCPPEWEDGVAAWMELPEPYEGGLR